MKQIIKMVEKYGAELRTRSMMEQFAKTLDPANEYLLDMADVTSISRSAADELYNITHDHRNVEMINLAPFVQRMLDAVILGRFQPRQHRAGETPIIYCPDAESFKNTLLAM